MAPAAASILAAAATSAASDAAEHLQLPDSSSAPALPQVDDDDEEAARGKHPKKQQQQQLECPRCRSTNTKFCYYNNYSTAQPRHFCRACRRYWTHGGTLRDVPVGGATRRGGKRRRLSSSAADPPSSSPPPPPPHAATQQDDLSTAFPFLSDGSYFCLPQQQLDLGLLAPAAFSWPSAVAPDFCEELLAPWDDGTLGVSAGAWGDIAGPEISWPPPGY